MENVCSGYNNLNFKSQQTTDRFENTLITNKSCYVCIAFCNCLIRKKINQIKWANNEARANRDCQNSIQKTLKISNILKAFPKLVQKNNFDLVNSIFRGARQCQNLSGFKRTWTAFNGT